jgi:succinylglutamate desuccinylase
MSFTVQKLFDLFSVTELSHRDQNVIGFSTKFVQTIRPQKMSAYIRSRRLRHLACMIGLGSSTSERGEEKKIQK